MFVQSKPVELILTFYFMHLYNHIFHYDSRFDSCKLKLNHKNRSCLKLTLSFTRFVCTASQTAEDLFFTGFPTHSLLKYL